MAAAVIESTMTMLMRPMIGSCAETGEQLSDHLDGTLQRGRARRVARHLRYCRRCRALYRSLADTVERVRALGRDDAEREPSDSVAETVVERIRRERL